MINSYHFCLGPLFTLISFFFFFFNSSLYKLNKIVRIFCIFLPRICLPKLPSSTIFIIINYLLVFLNFSNLVSDLLFLSPSHSRDLLQSFFFYSSTTVHFALCLSLFIVFKFTQLWFHLWIALRLPPWKRVLKPYWSLENKLSMPQKEHFRHRHPLIVDESCGSLKCFACQKRFKGPAYYCYECRYHLHESCAALPAEIQHFYHSSHSLTLHDIEDDTAVNCDACQETRLGFTYRCYDCDFKNGCLLCEAAERNPIIHSPTPHSHAAAIW